METNVTRDLTGEFAEEASGLQNNTTPGERSVANPTPTNAPSLISTAIENVNV